MHKPRGGAFAVGVTLITTGILIVAGIIATIISIIP